MIKKLLKYFIKTFVILFILINIVCIFQSYKLTHFKDGIGKMKNPENMSAFEKMSAIVFGVDAYKQASLDTFSIPHKLLKITTADGFILSSWYVQNQNKNIGTVILFHGHGGNKNGVIAEAKTFYNLGYNILLTDFRAHGNSNGNNCSIGYYESKDVKAAYDFIKEKGEKNIILYGISLGAATILKAIATDTIAPNKIILEMPFANLHKALKGRLNIMHLPQEPLATLLTFWGGVEQGFWAFNMQPKEYAKKINCPVLLQWGVNDARVTKNETEEIFNNIASVTHKKLVIYNNSAHQSLCINENEKWQQTLSLFLKQ